MAELAPGPTALRLARYAREHPRPAEYHPSPEDHPGACGDGPAGLSAPTAEGGSSAQQGARLLPATPDPNPNPNPLPITP